MKRFFEVGIVGLYSGGIFVSGVYAGDNQYQREMEKKGVSRKIQTDSIIPQYESVTDQASVLKRN